jgi:hypothetical protein
MSDVILNFAAPLITPEMPPEALQATLRFAMIVWNLPLVPAGKAAQYRTNLLNSLPHDGPQSAVRWANTIEQMIARRRELFPDDRRLLTNVQLVDRKGRIDIQTDYSVAEPDASPGAAT